MLSAATRLRSSTAAPPPFARRMVDTTRVRAPVRHLTLPGHETAATDLREGETLHALVARTGWATRTAERKWSFRIPTICILNGKPVLQREWRRLRLSSTDVVEFWSKPHGGGSGSGKTILGLVGIIALAAFAPWAGGLLASTLGLGSVAASVFAGIITIGGALLISALTTPKTGGQTDPALAAVDPIYSVSASGNTARLLQPRTVQYGRVKSFPDFAIAPWSEFIGNDQYLNVLLAISEGKMSDEAVYIDDTILWDSTNGVSDAFEGATVVEFFDPNETVTTFATNVAQAAEVSGQPLTTDYIGGFVANAAGSTATALAFDLVFPNGLFKLDDKGAIQSVSQTVVADARLIDDAGAPLGDWFNVATQTFTFATRNPQRVSIKVDGLTGRYEGRARVTDPTFVNTTPQDYETGDGVHHHITGYSGFNDVVWAGLRAFILGPSSFPVSTVAIRIKANSQLTQSTAAKFGYLGTRVLPVWDADEEIFVDTPTRSPGWAFYDAATNDEYGTGRPPSKVDFQSVFDLATAAEERGDTFDLRFSSAVPAPEAFDTILKGTRARHRWSGDMLTVVRDEWSDTPRMLLTDREIVRGSMNIDYALNTDDSADAVIVEYLDEDTWKPADVQYPPNAFPTFTSVQPTRIRLDGVCNREHANREAAFYYLVSQLRRVAITLDTEHDGRALGFGARVQVQSELPQTWGYTGYVAARATRTLTLSPAPTWALSGQHYIAIRDKTGRQFGPILCTKGATDALAVLDATDLAAVETAQSTTLTDALDRRDGADDPSFDFGVGASRSRSCLVVSGRPNGNRVSLKLIVDNENVHATDPGTAPVMPTIPPLRNPTAPLVVGLLAYFAQGIAEPRLEVSWFPSAGAQYYNAEVSYDSGASWTPIYQGGSSQCTAIVEYAALRVRVQGVGKLQGPWSQIDVNAPTITVRDQAVALKSLQDGIKAYVTDLETRLRDIETKVQESATIGAEQDSHNLLDKAAERGTLQSRTTEFRQSLGSVQASVTAVETTVADLDGAFASYQVVVNAQIDDVAVSVAENATAINTIDGKLAASYGVTLTVDGYASGFTNINTGVGSSVFGVHADYFYIAFPGQAGGAQKKVFTVGNVGGVAGIGISGSLMIDGTVTATKIQVGTLSALTGNVGTLTAGLIQSANGKMVFDLDNNRIVVSD